MMEDGLLDEVRSLRNRGYTRQMVSMQGLGYKEILGYLDGEYGLEEAIYILKAGHQTLCKTSADLV